MFNHDAANIPYYITGGVAAIAHGEPRATIDLDTIVKKLIWRRESQSDKLSHIQNLLHYISS